MANGLPVGACVAAGEAANAMQPGQHGSTFGGNPLVSRTACTVLDIMRDENLAGHAESLGQFIMQGFRERLGDDPRVLDIRGRGLMIGIELDRNAAPARQHALDAGLLVNVTQENIIRLLPPLIIDREQSEQIVSVVCDSIEALD